MINPSKTFYGEITTQRKLNFGYFTMSTPVVKKEVAPDIILLNENMKKKGVSGKIVLCDFIRHNGKTHNLSPVS